MLEAWASGKFAAIPAAKKSPSAQDHCMGRRHASTTNLIYTKFRYSFGSASSRIQLIKLRAEFQSTAQLPRFNTDQNEFKSHQSNGSENWVYLKISKFIPIPWAFLNDRKIWGIPGGYPIFRQPPRVPSQNRAISGLHVRPEYLGSHSARRERTGAHLVHRPGLPPGMEIWWEIMGNPRSQEGF